MKLYLVPNYIFPGGTDGEKDLLFRYLFGGIYFSLHSKKQQQGVGGGEADSHMISFSCFHETAFIFAGT